MLHIVDPRTSPAQWPHRLRASARPSQVSRYLAVLQVKQPSNNCYLCCASYQQWSRFPHLHLRQARHQLVTIQRKAYITSARPKYFPWSLSRSSIHLSVFFPVAHIRGAAQRPSARAAPSVTAPQSVRLLTPRQPPLPPSKRGLPDNTRLASSREAQPAPMVYSSTWMSQAVRASA